MAFTGIPVEAIEFYERLEADNSKSFWDANRTTYRDVVKATAEELCAELAEYGPFYLFRPHNDRRFHKNKPPYKTHQGAYGESEGGAGHYFHLSAAGLMCGTGYYSMAKDQLDRFRRAVDADSTGEEIAEIVVGLRSKRFEISAIDELKSAPRGYPKDHPRIELIRRKGLMASKDFGAPAWLHSKRAATRLRDTWEESREMNGWLDAHVGPSTLEPEGFFG
ncbi:MAG: DUF2461 domain-containing protein [Ilumatobacteraceae bacterium]